jgi:hypothetical protein
MHNPPSLFASTEGGAFALNLPYYKFNGASRDWKKNFIDENGKIRENMGLRWCDLVARLPLHQLRVPPGHHNH